MINRNGSNLCKTAGVTEDLTYLVIINQSSVRLNQSTGQDKKNEIGRQYDSSRLKDPVIKNEFQVLEDLNDKAGTENSWTSIEDKFFNFC